MRGVPAPCPGPSGWDSLPVLEQVFDHLEAQDLASAACACTFWRDEAASEARWQERWVNHVSDHGLWRWAAADGGYASQIRAKELVRKGEGCKESLIN
jgi:hypothetical protein